MRVWRDANGGRNEVQLRHARNRLPVALADMARLPLRVQSVDVVAATLIHTDVEDWDQAIREVARVLRPGGRFVDVGVLPCFVGPFAVRAEGQVRLHPGCLSEALTFDGPDIRSGIRSQVGGWQGHSPLSSTRSCEPG